MSKEMYIAAHEQMIKEFMEENPEATEDEAYVKTADAAYGRMVNNMSAQADAYADREK